MLGAALLATAGCATVKQPATDRHTCKADKAAGFVGQRADDALPERARRAAGAETVRVIEPGMIVTAEYRDDRLSIDVDENRTVTRIVCG